VTCLPLCDHRSIQRACKPEGSRRSSNTSAGFWWRSARTQVAANGNSVFRHYADLGEVRGVGSSVGLGVSTRLPGRMTLLANQTAVDTPAYLSGIFPTGVSVEPGSPGETAPDYTVSDFKSYTYTSTLSLKHDFSRRSSFVASGDFQYTDRQRESLLWQDVKWSRASRRVLKKFA
jgi:hypothetical protein